MVIIYDNSGTLEKLIPAPKFLATLTGTEEEITQRDIDEFNAEPVEFEEAFENNTIERGNNV